MADPLESPPDEWVGFLDELEAELARLRDFAVHDAQLLEMTNTQWHPPVGMGEMPADLAPRAAAIVQEIEAIRPELHQRREETVRQLRAVESVPRDAGLTSIYLDSVG